MCDSTVSKHSGLDLKIAESSRQNISASGEQSISQKIIPIRLPSEMTEYIKILHQHHLLIIGFLIDSVLRVKIEFWSYFALANCRSNDLQGVSYWSLKLECKNQSDAALQWENLADVCSDTRDDQKSRFPEGSSKLLNHSNQHWQCFLQQ
jgi:hypothetical protein